MSAPLLATWDRTSTSKKYDVGSDKRVSLWVHAVHRHDVRNARRLHWSTRNASLRNHPRLHGDSCIHSSLSPHARVLLHRALGVHSRVHCHPRGVGHRGGGALKLVDGHGFLRWNRRRLRTLDWNIICLRTARGAGDGGGSGRLEGVVVRNDLIL